jgi:hypothetical protein
MGFLWILFCRVGGEFWLGFSFNVANEEVDGVRKEKERLTTDHQPISDQAFGLLLHIIFSRLAANL